MQLEQRVDEVASINSEGQSEGGDSCTERDHFTKGSSCEQQLERGNTRLLLIVRLHIDTLERRRSALLDDG